jgi:hypothetical protein
MVLPAAMLVVLQLAVANTVWPLTRQQVSNTSSVARCSISIVIHPKGCVSTYPSNSFELLAPLDCRALLAAYNMAASGTDDLPYSLDRRN